MVENRFKATLKELDKLNAEDPNREWVDGAAIPKALRYSQRMTKMLLDFYPVASEILQIAARGQHLQRWAIPREKYPGDRKGYLKWRSDLNRFHADWVGKVMKRQGYSEEDIKKAAQLLLKRGLKSHEEAQVLEDVACLVFLKYYLEPFAQKHKEDKLITIIRKTWNKMSVKGHEAAQKIQHAPHILTILKKSGL